MLLRHCDFSRRVVVVGFAVVVREGQLVCAAATLMIWLTAAGDWRPNKRTNSKR